jgi:hypothetical protein
MRDIRGDLGDRAFMIQRQINAEHAQFETLIVQLKTGQKRRLEPLKAQLRAVKKLIDIAAWQYNLRLSALTCNRSCNSGGDFSSRNRGSSQVDGLHNALKQRK